MSNSHIVKKIIEQIYCGDHYDECVLIMQKNKIEFISGEFNRLDSKIEIKSMIDNQIVITTVDKIIRNKENINSIFEKKI